MMSLVRVSERSSRYVDKSSSLTDSGHSRAKQNSQESCPFLQWCPIERVVRIVGRLKLLERSEYQLSVQQV
jgi:hypothetical protein